MEQQAEAESVGFLSAGAFGKEEGATSRCQGRGQSERCFPHECYILGSRYKAFHSAMPLTPGTTLGDYEILNAIGAGGMGEVYRASDKRLGREVAIKILPEHIAKRADPQARFEHEARAVASLNHPNICTLYDIGSHDGIA